MKAIQQLHDLGQSLWLDNITRVLLTKREKCALFAGALAAGASAGRADADSASRKSIDSNPESRANGMAMSP
jgi:hypothetical protein